MKLANGNCFVGVNLCVKLKEWNFLDGKGKLKMLKKNLLDNCEFFLRVDAFLEFQIWSSFQIVYSLLNSS